MDLVQSLLHSLKNEPQFAIVVWAFAHKSNVSKSL